MVMANPVDGQMAISVPEGFASMSCEKSRRTAGVASVARFHGLASWSRATTPAL